MAIDPSPGAIDPAVVRLPPEVDLATAPALRDEMLAAVNRDSAHLVLDARGVRFMDSSGINALVRVRERVGALDGSLHVVSDGQQVRRVLQITRLAEHVGLVRTMDAALACVAHPETVHTCSPES